MLPSMQCGSSNPGGGEKQTGKALPRNIRLALKRCLHSTSNESSHVPTCYLSYLGRVSTSNWINLYSQFLCFLSMHTLPIHNVYSMYHLPKFSISLLCISPSNQIHSRTVGDLGPFAHKVKHPRISRDLTFTPMIRWLTASGWCGGPVLSWY